MPQFSALSATVLLCFWLLRLYLVHLGGADMREQMHVFLVSAYLMLLALSGWRYAHSRQKLWGTAHALLMLGVAACIGLTIFSDKADVAGHGPDANPAGPVLMVVRLMAGAVGIVALVCGIGVGWRSLTAQRNAPHQREPDV